MAMAVTQVRLPDGLARELDVLVELGFYSSRSDAVRDAIRRLTIDKMVGLAKSQRKHDSVKEVRALRKKLSRQPFDLDMINRL